ncbi:uncharacterized protein CCR75_003260 [Bremia lactucae]|uniref:Uncharacterized protein n=1 Tax=Bremia lactucae TaxID=4779 RepID=A0A976NY78_BRELC|nr:hypothetical protein CCR75_003260 [Bremia lactucae]
MWLMFVWSGSFAFAKLKAKGQLRPAFMPQNEERSSRYFSASADRVIMDRAALRRLIHLIPILVVRSVIDASCPSIWRSKTSTAFGQSCQRGNSNSQEFSEEGYPSHFTRYWY